jgi:hypothetical protein
MASWLERFADYKPTLKDWIIAILLGALLREWML